MAGLLVFPSEAAASCRNAIRGAEIYATRVFSIPASLHVTYENPAGKHQVMIDLGQSAIAAGKVCEHGTCIPVEHW